MDYSEHDRQDTSLHEIEIKELRDKWRALMRETTELVKALALIAHDTVDMKPDQNQILAMDALKRWFLYLEGKRHADVQ